MPYVLWGLLGLFVVLCYFGEREARRGKPHRWVLAVTGVLLILMGLPMVV